MWPLHFFNYIVEVMLITLLYYHHNFNILLYNIILNIFRTCCYIVTRCTNLVSVHYFLPLGI